MTFNTMTGIQMSPPLKTVKSTLSRMHLKLDPTPSRGIERAEQNKIPWWTWSFRTCWTCQSGPARPALRRSSWWRRWWTSWPSRPTPARVPSGEWSDQRTPDLKLTVNKQFHVHKKLTNLQPFNRKKTNWRAGLNTVDVIKEGSLFCKN